MFETPNEPQMVSVNDIQDKHNSMMLDLNDDLQDEIGTRREQFDSISKTCDDLRTQIMVVYNDMTAKTERNMKLAVIGIAIGVMSICANIAMMLFL